MPKRKLKLTPIDRCVVELTARIMGPDSAAALALQDANAHKGIVRFWESDHSIIVQKLPFEQSSNVEAVYK